jgi:hypothetical protein
MHIFFVWDQIRHGHMSPFLTHMTLLFEKEHQDKAPVLCVGTLALKRQSGRIASARINACFGQKFIRADGVGQLNSAKIYTCRWAWWKYEDHL